MKMAPTPFSFLAAGFILLLGEQVRAFNYNLFEAGGLSLTDIETSITDIRTLFTNELTSVAVTGVAWTPNETNSTDDETLLCELMVDGVVVSNATLNLTELAARELPDTVECGSFEVKDNGAHDISVKLTVDESEIGTSTELQAFAPGVSIIPLVVVLVMALTTHMVEFSLFFAIFVGACMVAGSINDGFKILLSEFILGALADVDHGYVYLFTLFLSGLVGMMEKSGGMIGFTRSIAQYAKTPRAGQFATFFVGCMVFFDDYANTLLAGGTMRPLTDMLFISREKLAFIVDATAAPIASIVPISSWVGFEVGLIDTEIQRLESVYGEGNLTIETSGLAVFLQSIKYRYYPLFMMMLIPVLILAQRDFGPMLIAERKTQVFQRTDGGDGKGKGTKVSEDGVEIAGENDPRPDTPLKAYNMLVPILLLVFFIFYLLVKTGDDGNGNQSFMDKIENSDSYSALLWGTMAAANIATLMYMAQIIQYGELVLLPTWPVIKGLFSRNPSEASDSPAAVETRDLEETTKMVVVEVDESAGSAVPRPLMSLYECCEGFLYGMGRIFPALIVLTLAWASGAIMTTVGADRLFSRWIVGGVPAEALPTLSFLISGIMALATGTSWGTMTILFPLICLPTYTVSDGDPIIFYSTVAGILSGAVAGDHMSPISDTTVLSSLASDCDLIAHVTTQAPYAIIVSIFAILFGTLPIGRDTWPNIVGILLGFVTICLFVYGLCVPILSPTGRVDFCTMIVMKYKGEGSSLHVLKEDTIRICGDGEAVEAVAIEAEETNALNPSPSGSDGGDTKKGEGDAGTGDEVVVSADVDDENKEAIPAKELPVEYSAEATV